MMTTNIMQRDQDSATIGARRSQSIHSTTRTRPYVVELVGLAGSGKSTITKALMASADGGDLGHFAIQQKLELSRATMAKHALQITKTFLPTYLRRWPKHGWFTRQEMRSLSYLTAWPPALQREQSRRNEQPLIQLMDLGPIFRFAYLQEFGSGLTKEQRYRQWQSAQLATWRDLVDLVIFLDAPDEVLQARIDSRPKAHVIKAQSTNDNQAFYQRYRKAYRELIEIFQQESEEHGVTLQMFDTSQMSVDSIIIEISHLLEQVTAPQTENGNSAKEPNQHFPFEQGVSDVQKS